MRTALALGALVLLTGCSCEKEVVHYLKPPPPPQVNPLPSLTNQAELPVSGTKAKDTSVLANGREIVSLSEALAWEAMVTLTEGENFLQFTSRNKDGLESGALVVRVVLDTVPPQAPQVDPVSSPTNTTPVFLTGTKEARSSLLLKGTEVIGVDASTQWGLWLNLAEGMNNLTFFSRDEAGNTSSSTMISIVLDTIAPLAPVVFPVASQVSTSSILISGTKESDTSLLLNGVEIISLGTEVTWSTMVFLMEGNNVFYFQAKDQAGNLSSPTTVSVMLDTVPPSAPLVISYTTPTRNPMQIVSGIKEPQSSLWLDLNGAGGVEKYPIGPEMLWSLSVSLTEGTNLLTFTSTDLVGNTSPPTVINILLDSTAPLPPTGVTFTVSSGIVFLDWADNIEPYLAGYNAYLSTTPGGPYTRINAGLIPTSQTAISGLTDGVAYYFVLTAVDALGNESAYSPEVEAIPRIPPVLSSIMPWRAPRGSYVTLTGSGFGPSQGTGGWANFNGGLSGLALTWTDTLITLRVPQAASSGPMHVIAGNAPSNPIQFLVMPSTGANTVIGIGDEGDAEGVESLQIEPSTGYPRICAGLWLYWKPAPELLYVYWDGQCWKSEVVDQTSQYSDCSLALDPFTYEPRIAYQAYSGVLHYARRQAGVWFTEVVDSYGIETGGFIYPGISHKLDPFTGYPRIAYALFPTWDQDLRFAWWTGSSWSVETVEGGPNWNVGIPLSMALNFSTGYPMIGYTDWTNGIGKCAWWTGTGWTIEGPCASGENIVFDPVTGTFRSHGRRTFIEEGGVLVTNINIGSWVTQPTPCGGDALALDPTTGYPTVRTYDKGVGFCTWDGAQWNFISWVDKMEHIFGPVALDPFTQKPRASHLGVIGTSGAYEDVLKYYAEPEASDLVVRDTIPRYADMGTIITVTGQNFGPTQGESKLLLGKTEAIVLTWTDSLITAQVPVTFTQTCGIEVVLDPSQGGARSNNGTRFVWLPYDGEVVDDPEGRYCGGKYSALMLSPTTEESRIAYESCSGELKYASYQGSSWSIETILRPYGLGGNPDVYEYLNPALALDPVTGAPKIAYLYRERNLIDQGLGYAEKVGGIWVTQTVDPRVWSYSGVSLSVDSTGSPGIAYQDGPLRYTYLSGGTWVTQTVSPYVYSFYPFIDSFMVREPSTGYPHLCYLYLDPVLFDCELRHAWWTGTGFTYETIETCMGNFGGIDFDCSIGLEPGSGYPWIIFFAAGPSVTLQPGLRYVRWTGSVWEQGQVEAGEMVGRRGFFDIAFNPVTGRPLVSYRYRPGTESDPGPNTLKLARWNGSGWDIEAIDGTLVGPGYNPTGIGNNSLRITSTGKARIAYDADYGTIRYWKEP